MSRVALRVAGGDVPPRQRAQGPGQQRLVLLDDQQEVRTLLVEEADTLTLGVQRIGGNVTPVRSSAWREPRAALPSTASVSAPAGSVSPFQPGRWSTRRRPRIRLQPHVHLDDLP